MTIPYSGPDLCALSASEVVTLLRRGEVSPAECLAASNARVAQTEPAINAMVMPCPDRAEERIEAGLIGDTNHPGWLAGLPLGIKDLNNVSGVVTSFGTPAFADVVASESDPIVARIEARGGLVVGKTNTPEMGAGANTFNAVYGRTRNPYDTSRNAGGSSGGAAASLATGQTWLSHGSDLAGSLRTPAAYCGIVGLRPTPGRVPGGAGADLYNLESVSGPMARSVRDCALFLDAMAGFDPMSPISYPAPDQPFQEAVDQATPNVRIAFSADLNGLTHVSHEMDAHLRAALEIVATQGATVEEACPDLTGLDPIYRTLRAMVWAAGPGRMAPDIQAHFKQTLADNIEVGRQLSVEDVYDARIGRSRLYRNMAEFLTRYDVLACPVVGLMPGPVEVEYPTEIDGKPLTDYIEWLKFSYLSTATSLPSLSVPVGVNSDGMPVGLQLIGPPRGEARLLQVARAIEMAMGGPNKVRDPNRTH